MQALISLMVILLFCLLGLFFSETFSTLKPTIMPALVFIMLVMGLTLRPIDFLNIFRKPFIILYAGLLQFTIMPLLGYSLASLMRVDSQVLHGAVLVGSAPGGTASNVITYLSRGDLAYSVSMTAFSTLLSPIFTPLWTYFLLGKFVEVSFLSMVRDLIVLVFLPVVAGLLIRWRLSGLGRAESLLPYLAIFLIGFIIAIVMALNRDRFVDLTTHVFALVIFHNLLGFLLGYLFALVVGLDRAKAKALSIEVGMQNSGLAVVLALKYFSPLSAMPGALFSLVQNFNGLLLSTIFRKL